VVTTRLHAALPCLAFGTPVLFIDTSGEAFRTELALELAHTATPDEFLRAGDGFDPLSPPPNPKRHLRMAEELERSCREFMQYR
jgi:hypothetical protein